jgi:hypothetical protein
VKRILARSARWWVVFTLLASACSHHAPTDSGVEGSLFYEETIGGIPDPFSPDVHTPHAGEIAIDRSTESRGWDRVLTQDVGSSGDFRIDLSPGRYRYVAWIPRLHEHDDSTQPLVRDIQMFVVRPHVFTHLQPTVYLELT